jgi:hypothetical protein
MLPDVIKEDSFKSIAAHLARSAGMRSSYGGGGADAMKSIAPFRRLEERPPPQSMQSIRFNTYPHKALFPRAQTLLRVGEFRTSGISTLMNHTVDRSEAACLRSRRR